MVSKKAFLHLLNLSRQFTTLHHRSTILSTLQPCISPAPRQTLILVRLQLLLPFCTLNGNRNYNRIPLHRLWESPRSQDPWLNVILQGIPSRSSACNLQMRHCNPVPLRSPLPTQKQNKRKGSKTMAPVRVASSFLRNDPELTGSGLCTDEVPRVQAISVALFSPYLGQQGALYGPRLRLMPFPNNRTDCR